MEETCGTNSERIHTVIRLKLVRSVNAHLTLVLCWYLPPSIFPVTFASGVRWIAPARRASTTSQGAWSVTGAHSKGCSARAAAISLTQRQASTWSIGASRDRSSALLHQTMSPTRQVLTLAWVVSVEMTAEASAKKDMSDFFVALVHLFTAEVRILTLVHVVSSLVGALW